MRNSLYSKITAVLLAVLIIAGLSPAAFSTGEEVTLNPDAYPSFADKSWGALYAHATLGGDSAQAWQRWDSGYSGINAQSGVRYFFLPNTANDSKVELYNNYGDDAVVGGVTIAPYTSAVVDYTDGQQMSVTVADRSYKLIISKSDSEASVYVNDTTNSYTDVNGVVQETDLYSFLIQNKQNSVKGSACAIANSSGVSETALKKIKGRGNTNWRETDKKPFNLTFNDMTTIGHTTNKKFSFVSNAKDSTLLRNSIMYDFANDAGSLYSPSNSFIDFFVNGVYRGCYIACQKMDLGKNAVVSLKDNSDTDPEFNFLVEVDVWNYKEDVYFVTDKGYHVVPKTPDLEGFDETDDAQAAMYNFMMDKYQEFENALYGGSLSELEEICDLNSLATQYLLQEFGKNCDGGYTSTYFTYNASENKFYAAPIWDCDSDLGAVDCVRDGCTESTCNYKGWITRKATYTYDHSITTVNPLGQAFNLSGTASDGSNFEALCKKIWSEKFLPNIDVLLGKADSTGRLKSIDEYAASINKARYNNYVMWDFMWYCAAYNSGLRNSYSRDYSGELKYLKDWTAARADWISSQYNTASPTQPVTTEPATNPSAPLPQSATIYFLNNQNWESVNYYTWTSRTPKTVWPGEPAQYVGKTPQGVEVYKAVIDTDSYKNIIFNDGGAYAQTDDIPITADNIIYIPTTVSTQNTYKICYAVASDSYENSAVLGDVNADGDITILDTTLIQKALINTADLTDNQNAAADTNKDGKVNIRDATLIQMHIAKIITI